jgi:hypothetical protein
LSIDPVLPVLTQEDFESMDFHEYEIHMEEDDMESQRDVVVVQKLDMVVVDYKNPEYAENVEIAVVEISLTLNNYSIQMNHHLTYVYSHRDK